MSLNESDLLHVMLYGSKKSDDNMNISMLTATIKFIKELEGLINLFLNITKNILIPSSIPLLIFLS